MTKPTLSPRQEALLRQIRAAGEPVQPGTLEQTLQASRPTINRDLRDLLASGLVEKLGDGRSTRYRATDAANAALGALPSISPTLAGPGPLQWSPAALPLVEALQAPLGTRTPVGYDRSFVDSYTPNQSSLLPPSLATDLYKAGRGQDQQPAGTYAREVLEQLLIDLSWSSSRLEGNNKSLLDTKALFELEAQAGPFDADTLMLLNHKNAIEFMVDAVPTEGITLPVIVEHRATDNGRAVVVKNGRVVLATGTAEHVLGSLTDLTFGRNSVVPDTDALLAAIGTAWALDIAPDLIGAGIKTFEPDLPAPAGLPS